MNNREPLTAAGIYQMIARRGRQCGVDAYPHRFPHHVSHTWLDRGGPGGDLSVLPETERVVARVKVILVTDPELSSAVIPLMKGAVYRDTHDGAWRQLLQLQPQAPDYVSVLGPQVVIDEAEGYAFLRQRPADPDDTDPPRAAA